MAILESDIRFALQNTVAQKKDQRPNQRRAAVLVPVITGKTEIEILLTQRTDRVEHHKNQISFPGGTIDNDDKSIVHAALRETEEELGIPSDLIEVLGFIDEVTTPPCFLVTPVVGILEYLPELRLNHIEVENAFTVPLDFFNDENNMRLEYRKFEGKKSEVYFYEHGDKTIWGVTAYIIRLFLRRISESRK
jgi:8-oxo-dGTP pyrophosphatase MutT (NUDIX family)